jgi:YHS domain-containing protein
MSETKTVKTAKLKPASFVTLCGRVFQSDPAYFPKAQYRGRTIHFCTEVCLDAFLSDPDRFVAAHKKSYKKTTEVVTT